MLDPQITFSVFCCLLIVGALVPLAAAFSRRWSISATFTSLGFALVGSTLITLYAIQELMSGTHETATLLPPKQYIQGLPPIALTLSIDRLASFFVLLIGGLSVGISIYSFSYLRRKNDRALIAAAYNLFVLFGVLFIAASNIFFFIVLLECVTLTFGTLVMHKHYEKPYAREHQQAIKTYLIANHFGGVFVLAALLVLAISHPGGATFDMGQLIGTGGSNTLVFFLAFIGFGIKAGIAPFHIWVSIAHPSSPTNTHAMSLGIMIKIALYGMIRVFFQFLHPVWWWGLIVLLVAALTALVGVRNALYGHTLKDSLADHSVENIGIILAGIGLAMLFLGLGNTPVLQSLAGLALVAGLYHLLNHTVFKGLLYLCTGAVDQLTGGVVELDRLGGLIHRYRWTSVCFLIGGIAIAGFPPFNGFISEWLTVQALFAGLSQVTTNAWALVGITFALLLLASAFALTAFAFVKITGGVFLGKARDEELAATFSARDVPWSMRSILVILAGFCLALGILPGYVIVLLGSIVSDISKNLTFATPPDPWSGLTINLVSSYHANLQGGFLLVLFALTLLILLMAWYASRSTGKTLKVWVGGRPYKPDIYQYTSATMTFPLRELLEKALSTALIAPIMQIPPLKLVIQSLTRRSASDEVGEKLEEQPIQTRLEVSEGRWVREPFRQLYNWLIKLLLRSSQYIGSFFQSGDLSRYLVYIFLGFILVFALMLVVVK
jgi:hydrogenase-4 component B